MNLQFSLTADDLADYYQYIRYDRPEKATFRLLARMIIVMLIVGMGAYVLLSGIFDKVTPNGKISFVLFLFALIIGWLIIQRRYYVASYRMHGKIFFKKSEYNDNFEITLSANQLLVQNSKSITKVPWTTIQQVAQTEALIMLFTAKEKAIIIPKRIFNSASEQNAFLAAIPQYVLGK